MFFSSYVQILIKLTVTNSDDPDQTLHYVASDLGLQCLSMPHKKDLYTSRIWVIILFDFS